MESFLSASTELEVKDDEDMEYAVEMTCRIHKTHYTVFGVYMLIYILYCCFTSEVKGPKNTIEGLPLMMSMFLCFL